VVPTVERGLRVLVFCSIAIAGLMPWIRSTSGLSIRSRNWRAYEERLSTYRRCPSAYSVSKARLDFPEPLTPVMTISRCLGRSSEMFFRLCTRAPRMTMVSFTWGREEMG
jgi:hypothetical protein